MGARDATGRFAVAGPKRMSQHPFYTAYQAMKRRCYVQSAAGYQNYGGRGIVVCDRWLEPGVGFWNFVEDMGDRPDDSAMPSGRTFWSIDRIDGDGPYSPENCKWSSPALQAENRSTTALTVDDVHAIRRDYVRGVTRWRKGNVDELAERYGVSARAVRDAATGKTWKHVN